MSFFSGKCIGYLTNFQIKTRVHSLICDVNQALSIYIRINSINNAKESIKNVSKFHFNFLFHKLIDLLPSNGF